MSSVRPSVRMTHGCILAATPLARTDCWILRSVVLLLLLLLLLLGDCMLYGRSGVTRVRACCNVNRHFHYFVTHLPFNYIIVFEFFLCVW